MSGAELLSPALRDAILNFVLPNLPPLDVVRLAQTCRYLHALADSEVAWRTRWQCDGLPNDYRAIAQHSLLERPWRTLYAKLHLLRRHLRPAEPLRDKPVPLARIALGGCSKRDLAGVPPAVVGRAKHVAQPRGGGG